MARDIVIFCDGTGNQFGDTNSNVLKLHDCPHRDAAEVLTFYEPGVGTFGLQEAMFAWRALAGMLHGVGLLEPGNVHLFDSAFRIYKKAFRRDEEGGFPILQRFKKQFCRTRPVHFLGVFDTVKSIGWFRRWMVLPWTAKNESVAIFRHALSIDEQRCLFRPNLWGDPGQTDVREVWFAGVHADVRRRRASLAQVRMVVAGGSAAASPCRPTRLYCQDRVTVHQLESGPPAAPHRRQVRHPCERATAHASAARLSTRQLAEDT